VVLHLTRTPWWPPIRCKLTHSPLTHNRSMLARWCWLCIYVDSHTNLVLGHAMCVIVCIVCVAFCSSKSSSHLLCFIIDTLCSLFLTHMLFVPLPPRTLTAHVLYCLRPCWPKSIHVVLYIHIDVKFEMLDCCVHFMQFWRYVNITAVDNWFPLWYFLVLLRIFLL
jgi:hypothetical protein